MPSPSNCAGVLVSRIMNRSNRALVSVPMGNGAELPLRRIRKTSAFAIRARTSPTTNKSSARLRYLIVVCRESQLRNNTNSFGANVFFFGPRLVLPPETL